MLWVKAFHIMAVIAWMAALLYLPRLLVYHCGAEAGSVQSDTFKVMERRLLKAIATPSMIAAWLFGVWLAVDLGPWNDGWFWVKSALVVAMTIYHMVMANWVRLFANDRNNRSARYYRVANEIPAVLMVAIVIMVVVKPF